MKETIDVKLLGSSNSMRLLSFLMLSAIAAIVGVLVHVGNQAETDQRNLESIGEQQVLSQRIAKYALGASTGESAAFDRLAIRRRGEGRTSCRGISGIRNKLGWYKPRNRDGYQR